MCMYRLFFTFKKYALESSQQLLAGHPPVGQNPDEGTAHHTALHSTFNIANHGSELAFNYVHRRFTINSDCIAVRILKV